MKKKQLTRSILLALAMSAALGTTGMAMAPITDTATVVDEDDDIRVENTNSTEASIKIENKNAAVTLETGNGKDIYLVSAGSGIRTQGSAAGSISLESANDNQITFDTTTSSKGNGIDANSAMDISLTAARDNVITSEGSEGDGVNAGANNTGTVTLTAGRSNVIRVVSDGIYTESSSTNDEEYIAENGNNEITAGNNGIDHRGSGTITLKAENGKNVIHAGVGQAEHEGDGLRVSGDGDVELQAKYNEVTGQDEGINIDTAHSEVTITATDSDENGIGNLISGADNGIQIIGKKITSTSSGETATGESTVTVSAESGANRITAGHTGITVNGNNNILNLFGNRNLIEVTGAVSESNNNWVYGINAQESGRVNIKSYSESDTVSNITVTDAHGAVRGIHAGTGGIVDIDQNALKISVHRLDGTHNGSTQAEAGEVFGVAVNADSLSNQTGDMAASLVDVTTNKDMTISVQSDADTTVSAGIYAGLNGQTSVISENGKLDISVKDTSDANGGTTQGIWTDSYGNISVETKTGINVHAENQGTSANRSVYGIRVNVSNRTNPVQILDPGKVVLNTEGDISVTAIANANSNASGLSAVSNANALTTGEILVEKANSVTVSASGQSASALAANTTGKNTIKASGNVTLTAESLESSSNGNVRAIYSFNGNNTVTTDGTIKVFANGWGTNDTVKGIHTFGNSTSTGNTNLTGSGIAVTATNGDGEAYGIYAEGSGNSKTTLTANSGNNVIDSDGIGIFSTTTGTTVTLDAVKQSNIIYAGEQTVLQGTEDIFGGSEAVHAVSGSITTLKAANQNALFGAAFAGGNGTQVNLDAKSNFVQSYTAIANAGDLNTDDSFKDKSVISALYAADGAEISVSGAQNVFRTYADNTNEDQLERVLWAYDGADITVDGATFISTDRYSSSPNSADIAIAAGSAVGLDADTVNAPVEDRATVTLNYEAGSAIIGDILAAYAGQVDIAAKAGSGAGISVTGNILSGNNGVLNLDLGQGGTLTGRADDYGDAGVVTDSGHTEFFNPAFSSAIYKGGEVNLTMGEGSRWNVTGQSWITRINTETAASADSVFAAENPVEALQRMATIDLTSEFSDLEKGGHALTVYDMQGDAAFNMKLHADRSVSDMLYMKHAEGNYIINVVDAVTLADMYAEGFDGLRFATVGAGSNASFRAVTVGQGVFNVEYEVGTDDYATSTENSAYNGESLSEKKPGDSMVDNFFGSEGTPGVNETGNEGIQTMALYAEETPDEAVSNDASEPEGPTNYKLIGRADEQTSNAGQTIIDMSKVNYSNAVYMDRLNKRMGEARYIEGDDGLWVRLRHDRIGKDDAFRSMNTMFELGYDWHAKGQKDGEHRQGVAFDYMRGTADYRNVAGDGDVRRAGVWLYDTWLGDKGHYSDYVVKYGRLSNDFDIYSELGEKISGDYDNDVWSVSAEYGRKKDIGNDWYIEPQAQMQYAYVTSADYTTSQGTKVELDGIDSLIGRAGFRLGRDTSEGNTVYFKADILHEFLGDQSIRAMDATGTLSTTYENEGTWYDVGFGFAHRMGKDSYVFLDVEHSFGNDNDDTYQINIGLNHAF